MEEYSKKLKIVSKIAIILFLLFLVWALYFKFSDINEVKYVSSTTGLMTLKERFLFDIIPFDFRNTNLKSLHLFLNILNMIVFAPLGVALCMNSKEIKWKRDALFCFLVSLIVELIQLFTVIGGFASDDLLMNTLGNILKRLKNNLMYSLINHHLQIHLLL